VFQNLLISIVIAPILLAVSAANEGDGARHRRLLKAGWMTYAVVWFAMLYYLRYRWN
jgi:hypothetical protein